MANESSSALPPLQRSGVWKFKLLRIVLLGTMDKGSILERLPKGHGVLDVVLGPVVVYYELLVAALTCLSAKWNQYRVYRPMKLIWPRVRRRVH